jgi:hypothetical protein
MYIVHEVSEPASMLATVLKGGKRERGKGKGERGKGKGSGKPRYRS